MLRRSSDKGEINVRGREQPPQVLELYQKALSNAGQLLASSKSETKESVAAEVPKVENGVQRNPLELLYPEMWAAVFEHLDNWRDLKSCYDTCQLFRDLLENSKNKWLFEGVLPLIHWHLEQSGTKEILKCRQICKAWKQQVDNSPSLCQYVSFQVSENGRVRIRQQIEDMVNHGKNPFVGQIVVVIRVVSDLERNWEERLARILEEHDHSDEEEEEAVVNWQDPEDNEREMNQEQAAAILLQDMDYFLHGLGKHITRIWFDVSPYLTKATALCHLVLCILSRCQGLKMLNLNGLLNGEKLDPLSEPEIDAVTPQGFTIAPTFQWLVTDVRGFLPIQNRILRLCAGQLKQFQTLEWTPSNLEMGALEELTVEHDFEEIDHLNIHQDLMQLVAPKLTKLTFPVNATCSLLNLLQLTNQFPKIEHLILQWNEDFVGFPMEQLLVIPEGLEPPHSLKTLQMSTYKQKYFDFLIFFPRLEYLKLSYWFIEDENEITDQCAIVQVSEYWTEDRMYESNVWELLPFLKAVMLSEDFDAFEDEDETLVYTRKEYTTINSKRSTC